VHRRGPLVALLTTVVLAAGVVLVMAGGLALRGSGLIAVGAAGVLAGCLAAGMAHEHPERDRMAMLESAVLAVGWTVGGLLLVCGLGALLGSGPTAVIVAILAVAASVVWVLRKRRTERRAGPRPAAAANSTPLAAWLAGTRPAPVRTEPVPADVPADVARLLPPVAQLSTRALGREWVRTTAALAGRLAPVVRASLVRRREDALDELERRDPVGFARWLAAGPEPGSDPADWLHSDSAGSPEAA
jgi:uncharacterized membrane protein YphA (DoxX/SURF4 family)